MITDPFYSQVRSRAPNAIITAMPICTGITCDRCSVVHFIIYAHKSSRIDHDSRSALFRSRRQQYFAPLPADEQHAVSRSPEATIGRGFEGKGNRLNGGTSSPASSKRSRERYLSRQMSVASGGCPRKPSLWQARAPVEVGRSPMETIA
jgi:hypothetical protein